MDSESSPETILQEAYTRFGSGLILACSFGGVSGMVLLDMTRRLFPEIPVFTVDTEFLFPETIALREQAATHYAFTPLVMTPVLNATPGPRLPSVDD